MILPQLVLCISYFVTLKFGNIKLDNYIFRYISSINIDFKIRRRHMKLKSLKVQNFRNFEDVEIKLTNQNVIFGMNDVGKTNLMYALRFLLDREIRKNGFKETDYFKNDTSKVISITLGVDISDRDTNDDSKHIISKVGGARSGTGSELDVFFFQVKGVYDESEKVGVPKIYWGNKLEKLEEIVQSGIFNPLDSFFKIVYLDPTIDLDKTSK